MSRIWTIARRELRGLFDHPTGYVLLVVFLSINAFLFFRQAYFSGVASLRPMLDLLPWILLFLVPAVSMRALAEDQRAGQLEVVLAQPLTELELLLGKYLGVTLFLWTALALTLPIPIGLAFGASLPWGAILAQYVGAALLAAGLAGIGLWGSGLARSQITAFIVGVGAMFVVVLIGLDPLLVGLPPTLGAIAARLGVLSHFDSIGRGVIDLRDAVYFVSLASIFLVLAYGALMARKLAPRGSAIRRLRLGVLLLVAALIGVNLAGSYISGRLDLTPGHAYTLSPATRDLVRGLPDIVTVKVFASKELPTEVALMKRDLEDVLSDLRSAGRGKVRVYERDPADSPEIRRDAQNLGIQPVQFNVVGKSELQVKDGFFGLAIQYADGVEAIPFIRQTEDLEYRLASSIRSLTRTKKPVLGLIDPEDPRRGRSFRILEDQLRKGYEVRTFGVADSVQPALDVSVLVLAGSPDSVAAPEKQRIAAFLARGGTALVLASGMGISSQSPVASPRPVVWNDLLKPFGVSIRQDMVYDLVANQIVPMQSDMGQVLQPYPLWIRARGSGASIIADGAGEIFLPWTSSIDTSGAGTRVPLLLSSRGSGVVEGETDLNPGRGFPQVDLKPRLLAVSATAGGKDSSGAVKGRIVVVGNSDFVADRYGSQAPANITFALNAVDWLAQDPSLIAIRSRDRRPPPLVFPSAAAQETVKYGNVLLLPVLVVLYGVLRLSARRRRARGPWRRLAGAPAEAA